MHLQTRLVEFRRSYFFWHGWKVYHFFGGPMAEERKGKGRVWGQAQNWGKGGWSKNGWAWGGAADASCFCS